VLLEESGLRTAQYSGLAMGLGLDRILMLRKGINDIRLLRASDPRISSQMLTLEAYRRVSSMPSVRRDLSLVLPQDTTIEQLGDQVRLLLGEEASVIESISVLSETNYYALPPKIVTRLGIQPGEKNMLLRIVLCPIERTLTDQEWNQIQDVVYQRLSTNRNNQV
jgi:phenylalanyl-tRNA synthetase alpha chain